MPDPSLTPPRRPGAAGDQGGALRAAATDRELRDELNQPGSTRDACLLDAALRVVTFLVHGALKGADGVSITLDRHGQMTTVAATGEDVGRIDAHQYAAGEGPCLAAAAEGRSFHSQSLCEEERWPDFTSHAIDEGVASVLATPVLLTTRSVGALNVYSRTERSFGPIDWEIAALYAARVGDLLGAVAVLDDRRGLRITEALTARDLIAMAQGVHMARRGISADAAAGELYRDARAKQITVRDEALTVLDATRHGSLGPEVDHG